MDLLDQTKVQNIISRKRKQISESNSEAVPLGEEPKKRSFRQFRSLGDVHGENLLKADKSLLSELFPKQS